MRFCSLSDPHLGEFSSGPTIDGINQRIVDLANQVHAVRQHMIHQEIKHLIIPGDIFKTKHPSMFVLSTFAELLYLFRSSGITTWIITGNHDQYLAEGQTHALSVFKYMHLPQVYIFDQAQGVEIEGVKFLFFPFTGTPQEPRLQEAMIKVGKADVLVMHGTVEGSTVNQRAEYEIHDPDEIKFQTVTPFRLVVAGHLHAQHHVGHVWYPGSLERLTFDDEGVSKGFLDITIEPGRNEPRVVPVSLPARPMITLNQGQVLAACAGLISVRDAIVRVVDAEWNQEEVRRELGKMGCYHVASVQGKMEQGVEIAPGQNPQMDDARFVDLFVQKKGYKGDGIRARTTIVGLLNK